MSMPVDPSSNEVNVVALETESTPPPPPPPSGPASVLHGVAIAGMATSALAGIAAMIAFITVRWTGSAAHFVIGAVVLSAVAFLASASAAVFTAARDTYARGPRDHD